MRKAIYVLIFFLFFGFANSVLAEMITFAPFYVIDRSQLFCSLYSQDQKIYVRFNIGITIGAPELAISCEDKWDWQKVPKILSSIANYINKNNEIDALKMLSSAGLSGLKVVKQR